MLLVATLVTLASAVILVGRSRDEALALAAANAELAEKQRGLAEAEQRQRGRAERRLAENYINLAQHASERQESRRGMLLLERALRVCPAEARPLQRSIRSSLGGGRWRSPICGPFSSRRATPPSKEPRP